MTDIGIDHEALERAVKLTLKHKERATVEQVQEKLREDDWYEVATFCSYGRQMESLKLKPWEIPPCWIDEDDIEDIIAAGPSHQDYNAARLAQRLIASNKSLFEPDPLAALVGPVTWSP